MAPKFVRRLPVFRNSVDVKRGFVEVKSVSDSGGNQERREIFAPHFDHRAQALRGRSLAKIVEADAAEHDWPDRPFAVIANLPFARSGAILARLLSSPSVPLRRAHLIVQWEFAVKHTAVWPSTVRSIYWRAWYDVSIARRLDRSAFSPPPSVDSAVLRLERRGRPRVPVGLNESYWRFLTRAFAAREPLRRTLRPSLSPLEVKRLAPALGFSPEARPWEVDAEQWAKLFAFASQRAAR